MKNPSEYPCSNCGELGVYGKHWILNNYFGISGTFCESCYDKVSHNAYKVPNNPKEYNVIFVSQQIMKATK
jgi:hypothetical protein